MKNILKETTCQAENGEIFVKLPTSFGGAYPLKVKMSFSTLLLLCVLCTLYMSYTFTKAHTHTYHFTYRHTYVHIYGLLYLTPPLRAIQRFLLQTHIYAIYIRLLMDTSCEFLDFRQALRYSDKSENKRRKNSLVRARTHTHMTTVYNWVAQMIYT